MDRRDRRRPTRLSHKGRRHTTRPPRRSRLVCPGPSPSFLRPGEYTPMVPMVDSHMRQIFCFASASFRYHQFCTEFCCYE